jgi:2-methylcitrate dehydratase PrpD
VIDNNALRSHCAQYVLALAAAKGYVHFYDIRNDRRDDPQIRSLSGRIDVIGDDELDRTYPDLYRSIIEVKTHGGACHARDIIHPRGSPEEPLNREELRQKFSVLTREVITAARAEEIEQVIDRLEDLEDIRSLTALLAKESHEEVVRAST